jgi:hypothetical protein
MSNLAAAQAEMARRKSLAAAQAEMDRRQAAASPRQAMLDRVAAAKAGTLQASPENLAAADRANQIASPVPPTPNDAQIQSQIDASQQRGATAAALLNKAGESMTLGIVGDEAAGRFDQAIGRGDYEERRDFYRDQETQLEADHPGLALAADVAPALLPGGAVAKGVAKLGTVVGRTAAGALAGATAAGTYGYAEGEGDDRAKNARNSAIAGAVLGAAAPKITDFAASIPARVKGLFVRSAKRPTIQALKATKNAAYRAVDEAGETFDGDTMGQLAAHVRKVFEGDNYVEETDNALKATLSLLDRRAGKETTLTQLDSIRKNLWKRYASAKDQPQILDAIASIDHVISKRGEASELMNVARAANSRYAKSQLLDDAFRKAKDQTAATGSGGNILNKYRQAVTSIINNERKAKFFTAGEIDMMREFVRGTPSENMKRLVGKLSPSGNGLMMSLHLIGGAATSGASLPLAAAGAIAKSSADKSAMRGASAVQDFVAGMPRQISPQSTGAALASGAAPVAERIQSGVQNMLNPSQLAPR